MGVLPMSTQPVVVRHARNPLITVGDVPPTAAGLEVAGVFNPGACRLGDEVILLLRVAEACAPEESRLKVPVVRAVDGQPRLEILDWKMDGPHTIDVSDPRLPVVDGRMYLSSISHLRVARSTDGVHFSVDPQPFLFPQTSDEAYGVEDCRITQIGDTFYITYTAVSADGFGVSLASTRDFRQVERHGMILHPQNKNTCLFPEKIADRYVALHRPQPEPFGRPSIWYAESPDLRHWGNHVCLLRPNDLPPGQKKIGAGPQPIRTSAGWLLLYHACGWDEQYRLFVALLDLEDPRRVVQRGTTPILVPEEEWERVGFYPNVVFANGWVALPDGRIWIYYGGADACVCLAETTETALLEGGLAAE